MCHRRDTRWRFCHRWVRVINPGHSDEIQRGPMPSQGEGRREGAAAETNLQAASAGREQEGGCGLNPTRGRGRESTGCRESQVLDPPPMGPKQLIHRVNLIAEFYLVDRGLRHRLPGFSSMGRLVILP